MCGICGLINKTENDVEESTLQMMTDAMIHRGPDDAGFWLDRFVGLGFRRLSIVDVKAGHQPMSNEDESVWVVCNGEIYNYQELRRTLTARGHEFKSHSDIEVICHLYEEEGIDCLNRLRGMFAVAIYDCNSSTMYIGRDYFGIKPLFYTESAETLAFASEIKSLLVDNLVKPEVNPQSLWDYMTFQYVPDPATMLQGVHKLPPAHYLSFADGKSSLHRYWAPEFRPDHNKSFEYFTTGIEDKLQQSVDLHLSGEVPRGALLSSGIDSSAIAALVAKREKLDTFSIGFEGSREGMNELDLACDTAKQLGTTHHGIELSAREYQDQVPTAVFYQDDPVADPSAIGLYFVSELASSHVTTILSGEGADEIFGGYPIYHEPKSLEIFDRLSPAVRRTMGRFADNLPEKMKGRSFLKRGSTPLERRFVGNAKIWTDDLKHEILTAVSSLSVKASWRVTDDIYQSMSGIDDITRMQMIDLLTWMPGDILMKADKMTMAHSVELRVPFLDKDLFEFAATVPTKYRIHGQVTKYALRQAVKNLLPSTIYNRPKLGFPVPLRDWLRGDMANFAWDVMQTGQFTDYVHQSYVTRLFEEHRKGYRDHAREIWTLLTFALWHQIFVEGSRPFAARVSPRVEVRRRRMEHGEYVRRMG